MSEDYRAKLIYDDIGRVLPRSLNNIYWTFKGHSDFAGRDWRTESIDRVSVFKIKMSLECLGLRPGRRNIIDAIGALAADSC